MTSIILINPFFLFQRIKTSNLSNLFITETGEVSSYWVPNGTVINNASGAQTTYTTIMDDAGNIWVSWWDTRKDGGDIYLQKISSTGKIILNINGTPIHYDNNVSGYPKMVLDGRGGAIITWQDNRTGQNEVYVQRVDSQGQLLWGTNGLRVSSVLSPKEFPQITNTSDGNFTVVWKENRTGTWDIYTQKFNLSGTKLWGENGTTIVNASGDQTHYNLKSSLIPTSEGGIIVTWRDARDDVGDVYVQRLDTNGVVQWDPNGTAICTAPDYQLWPTINDIGNDKFIVSWTDDRKGSGFTDLDLYFNKINGSGDPQWDSNGSVLVNASNNQDRHDLYVHDQENIFTIWVDDRVDSNGDIYMQKSNASGMSQWGVNGTVVANLTGEEKEPMIVTSGGALFVAWVKRFNPKQIYLMKHDLNGSESWSLPVSIVNGTQSLTLYNFIPDENGGVIITWTDARNDIGDMYMLRLDANGDIWTPSENGDGNPPDDWWLIILTIVLCITIPAVVGASLAAVFIMRRRRNPEVRILPKKVLPSKKLTKEEEKTLKSILVFFSILYGKKN